jgi:CheY-like chemotaxis protein
VRPMIDRRHHQLILEQPEEPMYVNVDTVRIEQVLTNILVNAAKYTENGGTIRVTMQMAGGEALVRIEDTGIGMEAEFVPQVFQLFVQADRSLDHANGGLGIGLTLARSLMAVHGGRIEAFSPGVGCGSIFEVRLPVVQAPRLRPTPSVSAATLSAVNGHGPVQKGTLRILVVDDNMDAAETLSDLLRVWGHEVELAYTGLAALEIAGRFQPDVVLLDIGLPGADGYAIARELASNPETSRARLVAISGYSPRVQSREGVFERYLTKPVDFDELRGLLSESRPGS